jgi:hypothetical protein
MYLIKWELSKYDSITKKELYEQSHFYTNIVWIDNCDLYICDQNVVIGRFVIKNIWEEIKSFLFLIMMRA